MLAFLIPYCALTGYSAASIRASIMLLLVTTARMLGRSTDTLTLAAVAMLVILLWNPLQAYSAGFILSFSAVAGISLLYPVFHGMIRRVLPSRERDAHQNRRKLRTLISAVIRYLGKPGDILAMSLAAQIGVLLPTMSFFHSLPTYGVFINILIIPYVSILVPLYALTLITAFIPYVGAGFGWLAALFSRGLLGLVGLLQTLPYASISVAAPSFALCICIVFCVLILSRRMRGDTARRALALAVTCTVGVFCVAITRPPETRYIQLSVEQEDAAILFAGDQTVVIDVGTEGESVADYLIYENRSIDVLYLTHLHEDHIAGVSYLLEQDIPIKQVYIPINAAKQAVDEDMLYIINMLYQRGIPIAELAAGDEAVYSGVPVRVLWPNRDTVRTGQDPNDMPLVLSIELDGYTLLSAADLSGVYENYAAIPCDVLKIAHHGSNNSSYEAFLDFTDPTVALISCAGVSAALPGADTLKRLADRPITVLRTNEYGDITIVPKLGQLIITPYKGRIKP